MKGQLYEALQIKEFLDKGETALCVDVLPQVFACYGNRIKLRLDNGFEYWDYEYNGLRRVIGGSNEIHTSSDACKEIQQALFTGS